MARPDLSGQVIDRRYQIMERIAEGAMGVVYRGVRLKLDRPVAIKVMHASLPGEMEAKKRFEREAQLMARLEHPHCVSIIDFGLHEEKPYVVMELVRGRSLHDMLSEAGRLEIPRAVDILRQVLSGLAHAHEQGIIHRDIKPANIMTTPKAPLGVHARILDFGLARMLGGNTSLSDNVAVGTPSYMAPEQCRGDQVDVRVDIYACGVMLFEMLTGKKPFIANDPLETIKMQLKDKPPLLSDVTPGNYGAFEGVVARALAKLPDERYRSAVAMAEALDAALGGSKSADSTAQLPLSSIPTTELPVAQAPRPPGESVDVVLSSNILSAVPADGSAEIVNSSNILAEVSADEPASADSAALTGSKAPRDELPAGASALRETAGEPGSSIVRMLPVSRTRWVVLAALVLVGGAIGAAVVWQQQTGSERKVAVAPPPITADAAITVVADAAPSPSEEIVANATQLAAAGKVDKAINMLVDARRVYPDRAELPLAAGKLYLGKLWWNDGLANLREAIKLDPSLSRDPSLLQVAVRAFATTPSYEPRLGQFLAEIGPPAIPLLEDIARTGARPQIRERASSQLRRMRSAVR